VKRERFRLNRSLASQRAINLFAGARLDFELVDLYEVSLRYLGL